MLKYAEQIRTRVSKFEKDQMTKLQITKTPGSWLRLLDTQDDPALATQNATNPFNVFWGGSYDVLGTVKN